MPKYYIDITENGRVSQDQEGSELGSDEEARREAIAVLPDIARDELPNGNDHSFEASVRTESGRVIFRATLTLHAVWLEPDGVDQG